MRVWVRINAHFCAQTPRTNRQTSAPPTSGLPSIRELAEQAGREQEHILRSTRTSALTSELGTEKC